MIKGIIIFLAIIFLQFLGTKSKVKKQAKHIAIPTDLTVKQSKLFSKSTEEESILRLLEGVDIETPTELKETTVAVVFGG